MPLARFWAAALLWEIAADTDEDVGLVPTDGTLLTVSFPTVPEPKAVRS